MTIQAISADGTIHEFPDGTDTDVIGKVMRDYAQNKTTVLGSIEGGLHDAGTGLAQTAQAVGGVMARNGMPEYGGDVQQAGTWLANHTPDAPAGPTPGQQLEGAIQHGEIGRAAELLPYAALRMGVGAAPAVAASRIPYVGLPLAAAYGAAESLGPTAFERAQNNGRSVPDTADVVASLPSTAVGAAAGMLGGGAPRTGSLLLRAAKNVLRDAGAGAAMDTAQQLGGSVGTNAGASFDPLEAATAGVTGASLGAGRIAPEAAADAVGNGLNQVRASRLEAPTPEDAQSVIRVGQAVDAVKQTAANAPGQPLSDTTAANVVRANIVGRLTSNIAGLQQAGLIGSGDVGSLQRGINALRDQRNNPTDGLPDLAAVNSQIDALGLPDTVAGPMKDDFRDLNTAYSIGGSGGGQGAFQRAGALAGRTAAIGLGAASGSLHGVAEGLVGSPLAARVGGYAGSLIDGSIGNGSVPPLALRRILAARVLQRAGMDPNAVPSSTPIDPAAVVGAMNARNQAQADQSANDDAAFLSNWAGQDAEAADALKAKQIASMVKQKAAQDASTDAAFQSGQPDTSATDAYLTGTLSDPSLLPTSKAMTTAQEISLNLQRLRNQQVQDAAQADQAKRYANAEASGVDALAQTALDKAARQNAVNIAAAQIASSSRPDVPTEAAAAASTTALQRAQAIMAQASGPGADMVDRAAVGLPPTDPVPVNTPLGPTGLPLPMPNALARSLPASGPASRLQIAQTAMTSRPPWSRFVANGDPSITHPMVLDTLRQAEIDGAVPPGSYDLLSQHNGGADRSILTVLQARLASGLSPNPSANTTGNGQTNGATADQPTIRSPLRYRLATEGYQRHVADYANHLRSRGHTEAANATVAIAQGYKTKAGKRAARASLPADMQSLVPDFVVDFGSDGTTE